MRGSHFHAGAHDVLLQAIGRSSTQVQVVIRDSELHSVFERVQWSPTQYFLRNRAASEAVHGPFAELADRSQFSLWRLVNMYPASSSSAFPPITLTIRFDRADRHAEPPWQLDDRWIDAAELVIVRSVPEGSVIRPLEIPNLDLRNAPPSERQ
jgi:hypothetical protein